MDYLSESAVFICPMGYPAKIVFPGQTKVSTAGGAVLTDKAKIAIIGMCPRINPNPPPPCPNTFSPWSHVASNSMADGGKMLTKDSYCSCTIGKISISNSGVGGKLVKQTVSFVRIPEIMVPVKMEKSI